MLVHIIFSTKERRNLISSDIEPELYRYIGGICRNNESPLLAGGGTENHVHLVVSLSKNMALSDLLMVLKKDSSKWIKTKGPLFADFRWQDGYGAFSIGESQAETVRQYVGRQKEKHRRMTFEEEYVAFLTRYKVPFDPRYVWT
jgi:REP element-mobilizing transposase RayT